MKKLNLNFWQTSWHCKKIPARDIAAKIRRVPESLLRRFSVRYNQTLKCLMLRTIHIWYVEIMRIYYAQKFSNESIGHTLSAALYAPLCPPEAKNNICRPWSPELQNVTQLSSWWHHITPNYIYLEHPILYLWGLNSKILQLQFEIFFVIWNTFFWSELEQRESKLFSACKEILESNSRSHRKRFVPSFVFAKTSIPNFNLRAEDTIELFTFLPFQPSAILLKDSFILVNLTCKYS